jgi:DNA-binding transcriptional ArsR family regulator
VLCEQVAIRALAAAISDPSPPIATLQEMGVALSDHVRLEERSLFLLIEELCRLRRSTASQRSTRTRTRERTAGSETLLFIVWLCKTMTVIDLPVIADPDDALSQPTRARLFALLSELKRPAGTVELAERLELHPNGVRVHLERLVREGLAARASGSGAAGRRTRGRSLLRRSPAGELRTPTRISVAGSPVRSARDRVGCAA